MFSAPTKSNSYAVTALFLVLSGSLVASPSEFYVLQGVDKSLPDSVFAAPRLDGFTIRISWRKLHEEGFAWLDEQVHRGDQFGVNVQLRVMAGVQAPDNLVGVSYFDYLSEDSNGVTSFRRAPVPWDAAMQAHWRDLVSVLGMRYGDNPRIQVVHVPSFANTSEMHMPQEVTELAGYSSRRLAESWAAMAEPLTGAFLQSVVALNYATPSQSRIAKEDSEWLLEQLAGMAGERAGYQANDLSADVTLDRNKYEVLIAQRELGRRIGFQMLSASHSSRFSGSFLDAVAIGSQAGAQWYEIYAADIENLPPVGDYNLNGIVDAVDYVVWRDKLGLIGEFTAADGNSDDRVDAGDYQIWKSHFGQSSANNQNLVLVPEPATGLFVVMAISLMQLRRCPRNCADVVDRPSNLTCKLY